ncbi:unnamed protein product, partial [Rotaria sordida]
PECELLGKEIDLQKLVAQIWPQNAREKEKKNPNFFKNPIFQMSCKQPMMNNHLFTSKHT